MCIIVVARLLTEILERPNSNVYNCCCQIVD